MDDDEIFRHRPKTIYNVRIFGDKWCQEALAFVFCFSHYTLIYTRLVEVVKHPMRNNNITNTILHTCRWHIISAKMQKKTPRECRKRWGGLFVVSITILNKCIALQFSQLRLFEGKEYGPSLLRMLWTMMTILFHTLKPPPSKSTLHMRMQVTYHLGKHVVMWQKHIDYLVINNFTKEVYCFLNIYAHNHFSLLKHVSVVVTYLLESLFPTPLCATIHMSFPVLMQVELLPHGSHTQQQSNY